MKVAVYARVSNADQHNAIQIRELTEHVGGSSLASIRTP